MREKAHSDHEKPFLDHLEDLRVMITRVVVTLVISMIVCFSFQKRLMEVLRKPVEEVWVASLEEKFPDTREDEELKPLTVEIWEDAKQQAETVGALSEEQRSAYFAALDDAEMEFHVRSLNLMKAARVLPEGKREAFLNSLGIEQAMVKQVLSLLTGDLNPEVDKRGNLRLMSALKPTETFMLSMKLSFFAGIVISFPLLLMYILQFVIPGLHHHEKRVLWPALAVGFGLFLGGVSFAYYIVLPRALTFFYEWSGSLGVSNDWRIGEYITFAVQFTLLFGLSFELPVIVMVLVKLGLLTYETMSKTRTYAIVAIFVIAAIITPTPDIMTLILMASPMILLYEMCIWLAWFDRRKEIREEAELERKRLDWLLSNDEPKSEASEGPGDHGWDASYEPETHHGMPEDEEWVEPEDLPTPEETDSIPEEERRRMDDYGTDRDG